MAAGDRRVMNKRTNKGMYGSYRKRRIMRGPVLESAKSRKTCPTSGSSAATVMALGPNSRRQSVLASS